MFRGRYQTRNTRDGGGTYQRRGAQSGRGSSYQRGGGGGGAPRPRVKGLFTDGIWHCDCTLRLPAEKFQVKKGSPNKGRWFYTCQKRSGEDKGCGLFLWDEDAKPREEAAVLHNGRSEPGGTAVAHELRGGVQEGWNAGREGGRGMFSNVDSSGRQMQQSDRADSQETLSPSPSPPYTSSAQPQQQKGNGSKRTAQAAGFDSDEEPFDWPLTGQETDDLERSANRTDLRTPHKAQRMGIYDTPAATTERKRRLPWLESDMPAQAPATPAKATKATTSYCDTPSKAPTCAAGPSNINAATTTLAPPTFATAHSPPPPSRYKDALSNPADSASSLTSEVMAELADTALIPATRETLRSILSKHDLRTQGIVKGRDISRLALKAKDAKVAELQARIASLEAEREVDREVLRKISWDKEHGQGGG